MTVDFAARLQVVLARIRSAEMRFGRPSGSVGLVAVSKTHPVADIVAVAGRRSTGLRRKLLARGRRQIAGSGSA
jgi:uncharacterized pyridoxal phosphate-containing UPF0001 family protein